MDRGYFAGLRASLYRRTRDGRLVFRRRVLPGLARTWFLVRPEEREAFEKRSVQAHVASLALIAIGAQFWVIIGMAQTLLLFVLLSLVVAPASLIWMTRGLETVRLDDAELEPVDRRAEEMAYARALGGRTLWGMIAASVVMLSLQVVVLITDPEWWSWLGVAMFGAMAAYFIRLGLWLRADKQQLHSGALDGPHRSPP